MLRLESPSPLALLRDILIMEEQQGDIRLIGRIPRTRDALAAQLADIIEAGRIDEHDRADARQFHCLVDRIGRRPRHIGYHSRMLTG